MWYDDIVWDDEVLFPTPSFNKSSFTSVPRTHHGLLVNWTWLLSVVMICLLLLLVYMCVSLRT
jgi:hypothetical protein